MITCRNCQRRPTTCRGLCNACYRQGYRTGTLDQIALPAARHEQEQARRDALAEDVEWIVGTDSPERIAARVGYTPEALEKALRRMGRADLWNRMQQDMPAAVRTYQKVA